LKRPIDDDGDYYERRSDPNRADREISLGAPTILGIFFGIALLCACFFGFGYTMGHSSARNAQAAAAAVTPAFGGSSGAIKPTAGSPVGRSAVSFAPSVSNTPPVQSTPTETPQRAVVSLVPTTPKNTIAPSDRIIAGDKPLVPPAPQQAIGSPQPATVYMVQVAAVSSQDVADILLASLQKKGYTVAVHHEAQDKLLHVQIGPFPDRKDAEAMQKRVLADGFNAIVK
jgi:DedD protein